MKMMSDLHANHHYAKTNNEGGDGRRGGGGLLYDTIKILKNITKELRSYFICTNGLAAAHDGKDRYNESTRDIQYIRQHRKIVRSWKMHTEVLPDDEVDFKGFSVKKRYPDHDLFRGTMNVNVQFLSETVGSLKDRIAQVYHVPANKQKLISIKAGDMEDNLSLAHYNVGGDDYMLFLSIEDSVARLSMKSPNGIIT
ncbi:probable splicing factor 3A subunit 1 [Tanacetum coccineum]